VNDSFQPRISGCQMTQSGRYGELFITANTGNSLRGDAFRLAVIRKASNRSQLHADFPITDL